MNKFKLSVIVPIYNTGKFLSKCLDKILEQKYKDFELILVNDASTDNSHDICNFYSKKRNVTLINNEKNFGVVSSCLAGINSAKGDYLCFVDSDDFIEYDYFTQINRIIDNVKPDIIIFGYNTINNDKLIKHSSNNFNLEGLYENDRIVNVKSNLISNQVLNYELMHYIVSA